MSIPISNGSGASSVAAEAVSGLQYQQIEVYGKGGSSILSINPDGSLNSSIIGIPTMSLSGSPSISGAVTIVGTPTVTLSGTPSISGTVNVAQSGSWTISGSVLTLSAPTASLVSGVTSVITGTSSVLVLAAAPGGQRNYITNILVTNGSATLTEVSIVDNGSIIYSGFAAASGGGYALTYTTPLKQPTSVMALYAASSAQASIIVAASGYTSS